VIDINQQTKMVEYNQVCISRDNVQFEVSVVVFYRIFDTLKAAYRLGNLNFDECVK
jgi:regulator of protease activity HflC (stomatin/prohibitin superfamily)